MASKTGFQYDAEGGIAYLMQQIIFCLLIDIYGTCE